MNQLFSLGVPWKTLKAITIETREPASAWMNQHSSQYTQGLSMDEDVACLNDDDNPAPEEVNTAADEALEEECRGGPTTRVP